MATWPTPRPSRPLDALCPLPGSKSESNRALILLALADGPGELTGLLQARDTELMVDALRQFGVQIIRLSDAADGSPRHRITPPSSFSIPEAPIDCGLAGTVMRFVPPMAALAGGRARFIGDPKASERPMGPLLDGLRQLGVRIDDDALPLTMISPELLGGPVVEIDSSTSSQFISALLLSAARFPAGIDLLHCGPSVPSLPHIGMTVAMLRDRGVRVDDSEACRWVVSPGPIAALDQHIEPDLTNAAVFLAAGVLSGGQVTVPGWPTSTTQPGDEIRDVLGRMGAEVEFTDAGLRARSVGPLRGGEFDLHSASELTPVVAALATFAEGTSTITGVAHIRGHETDRLAAIEAELSSLGVRVHQLDDGVVIEGAGGAGQGLAPTRPLHSYADHRIAHLAVLTGLVVDGVTVVDIESVSKTMPDFTDRWAAMLAQTAGAPR